MSPSQTHHSYINTRSGGSLPQLLQVLVDDHLYRLNILRLRDITVFPTSNQGREHHHPVYHITLHTHGVVETSVSGRRIQCVPGDLLIIEPNQSHSLCVHSLDKHRRFALTFEYLSEAGALTLPFPKLLELLFGSSYAFTGNRVHLQADQAGMLSQRFHTLYENLDRHPEAFRGEAGIAAFQLFAEIANALRQQSPPAQDALDEARLHITRHYADKITIDELAGIAHYSPNHFIAAFRKRFDKTPIACQHELRIQAAQNLLLASSLSIQEIATEIGFNDVHYFSRVFKKNTGIPPRDFRNANS